MSLDVPRITQYPSCSQVECGGYFRQYDNQFAKTGAVAESVLRTADFLKVEKVG